MWENYHKSKVPPRHWRTAIRKNCDKYSVPFFKFNVSFCHNVKSFISLWTFIQLEFPGGKIRLLGPDVWVLCKLIN